VDQRSRLLVAAFGFAGPALLVAGCAAPPPATPALAAALRLEAVCADVLGEILPTPRAYVRPATERIGGEFPWAGS